MRLYIIRHAEPDYESNTITAAGHREAAALAERMRAVGLDAICCSPKGRARDTMQYTADATGIEPVIEDWLREWDRWYVDLPAGRIAVWDLPGELIRGREVLPTRDDWHGAAPLDDPAYRGQFEATAAASDAFLARHGYQREGGRYRQTAPNERRLAVFCHLGLGLAWIAHLLELPLSLVWSGFWLPASSVTTIVMECRSGDWAVPRCLGLGDVSHLHAAGLPVSPAGLHTGETCRP